MNYKRGDIFEVCVDGDLSGGPFITNPQLERWDSQFQFKSVHAQNYHIFTPPGEGRDWCMVWGSNKWIDDFPYANQAYNYTFKEGESGHLVLEFWITPFDYAPSAGPERAVISELQENKIIGLSWSVLDYDEDPNPSNYEGFWSLSHSLGMTSDGSSLQAFRLMPLEQKFLKPIEAEWSFTILDMNRRLVAFQNTSYETITSWLWDFDDDTTSTEQHPVHQFQKEGEYTVVLTVKGLAGTARRIKTRDVIVR